MAMHGTPWYTSRKSDLLLWEQRVGGSNPSAPTISCSNCERVLSGKSPLPTFRITQGDVGAACLLELSRIGRKSQFESYDVSGSGPFGGVYPTFRLKSRPIPADVPSNRRDSWSIHAQPGWFRSCTRAASPYLQHVRAEH